MKYKSFILISIFLLILGLLYTPFFTQEQNVEATILDQMDKCIKDGQIPCRWVPDLGGGYGYPLFNYYAPLPYYFVQIINFFSNNFVFSVRLMFILTFIGTFFSIFFLSKEFISSNKAIFISIIYSFFPHLFLSFYSKDPTGKLWLLMSFPLIVSSFFKLYKKRNASQIVLVSLSAFILLTSYYLSVIIFFIFVPLFVLFLYFNEKRETKFILYAAISIVLGICLSSFYIIPAFFESNLIHKNTRFYGYLPIYAQEYPAFSTEEKYQILTGDAQVDGYKSGTNWFTFKVDSKGYTILRLSQYYFPNWTILVNGKNVNVEYKNNSLGLMTLILDKGSFWVQGRLVDTPIRVVANAITVVSGVVILIISLTLIKSVRKGLLYYLKAIN